MSISKTPVSLDKTIDDDDGTDLNDIVVALIDDSATVKTFYKENGKYRLQPENKDMLPIIVDEVIILGKVIASYRYY